MVSTSVGLGITYRKKMDFDYTANVPKLQPSFYQKVLSDSMSITIGLYEKNANIQYAWNFLHRRFKCCGVINSDDWANHNISTPDSCLANTQRGCMSFLAADLAFQICLITGLNCIVGLIQVCIIKTGFTYCKDIFLNINT